MDGFDRHPPILEPIQSPEHGFVLAHLPKDNLLVDYLGLDQIEKDAELKRLLTLDAWPITGDFTRTEEGKRDEHCLNEDIRSLFEKNGKDIERALRKNVYFVEDYDYAVCTQLILSTYIKDYFRYSPRLLLIGSTQSGKSRLQKVIQNLSYRGMKIGNISYAVTFRLADEFSPTLIIDEFQDLPAQTKIDLMNIAKEGFESGGKASRCNANSFLPEFFNVYTPLVISTKDVKGITEDVINRSFVIKMIEAPSDYPMDKIMDLKELNRIRQNLHHLRFALSYQRQYFSQHPEDVYFNFEEYLLDCNKALTGISNEDGSFSYPDGYGFPNGYPELKHRLLDIALTMYPLARLTNRIPELLQALERTASRSQEVMRLDMYARIIDSWVDCLIERYPKTPEDVFSGLLRIPTVDIRDKCWSKGLETGDFDNCDKLRTRDLRAPLMNMGFDLHYGRNNKTFVCGGDNFRKLFETNLKRFGSNSSKEFYLGLVNTTNLYGTSHPDTEDPQKEVRKLGGKSHD